MEKYYLSRRKIVAEQIETAITDRKISRKQFAQMLHRSPSEVTKWLSGNHNFTIELLDEISAALGTPITGVDGYNPSTTPCGTLNEPAIAYGIDQELSAKIIRRANDLGLSVRTYLCRLVEKEISDANTFPKIDLSKEAGAMTRKYSGIVKVHKIEGDEKFERIWKG